MVVYVVAVSFSLVVILLCLLVIYRVRLLVVYFLCISQIPGQHPRKRMRNLRRRFRLQLQVSPIMT
jgi:hypothetical protein